MSQVDIDRRVNKRFDLPCPVIVIDGEGRELLRGRTTNVSDGGALLPAARLLPLGQDVHANLRVPRRTSNTFMYEDFFAAARVVRHQADAPGSPALAIQFTQPVRLQLDA